MFGLTEADVRQALRITFPKNENMVQSELEKMTAMYNGYRFSADSDVTVFNTTTAMEYLQVSIKRANNRMMKQYATLCICSISHDMKFPLFG